MGTLLWLATDHLFKPMQPLLLMLRYGTLRLNDKIDEPFQYVSSTHTHTHTHTHTIH
jgi:hypothetical protein